MASTSPLDTPNSERRASRAIGAARTCAPVQLTVLVHTEPLVFSRSLS